ncbi:hypothetical protein WMY93_032349 [Mugilogobius chulae]|uniref:Uncharacterized protein n=1 Tax=Mugilogobius chulae TaxID=88201 RepID=A0AAW0MNK1_9GOBI
MEEKRDRKKKRGGGVAAEEAQSPDRLSSHRLVFARHRSGADFTSERDLDQPGVQAAGPGADVRARGATAADTQPVPELMRLTYALQRQLLNSGAAPSLVRARFPFLFTAAGISAHFHTLTAVELRPRMRDALQAQQRPERRAEDLLSCKVQARPTEPGVQSHDHQSHSHISALLLVMSTSRREKKPSLYWHSRKRPGRSVESSVSLPVGPRIVALGDSVLDSRSWMVSLDRTVASSLNRDPVFPTFSPCFSPVSLSSTWNMKNRPVLCGDKPGRRDKVLDQNRTEPQNRRKSHAQRETVNGEWRLSSGAVRRNLV